MTSVMRKRDLLKACKSSHKAYFCITILCRLGNKPNVSKISSKEKLKEGLRKTQWTLGKK